MSERACSQGCTRRGQHYAACPAYGAIDSDECSGCVAEDARDGALVCAACYGRLRRRLEVVPDLIAHIREMQHTLRAKPIGGDRQGTRVHAAAPVSPDMLDASRDIAEAFTVTLNASMSAGELRAAMHGGVGAVLASFDEIANDAEAFAQWWHVVMPTTIPEAPDYWTVTRALVRWPLEDKRWRWGANGCPDCDLRTVKVYPPMSAGAREWYECAHCDFSANDQDEDGLWRLHLGAWAELTERTSEASE